jgi:glycosyltransferase involved in cell wall biosynthesis
LKYSLIIPAYKSAGFIDKTIEAVLAATSAHQLDIEIILVNDGSPDNTWHVIKSLAANDARIRAVNLLKNYGQHNAVLCGMSVAKGEYLITLDDDLQNPPDQIIHLIRKAQEGDHDLVFGKFLEKKHSFVRRLGSKVIGYLNGKIFDKPEHITLSNFRIIRRDLAERVLNHKTAHPYIPGMLLLYAASIANVDVQHQERLDGVSNYTLSKIIALTSRLLINYSSYPLRLLSTIGLGLSTISLLLAVIYLIKGIFEGSPVPGWTTLAVLVSFLGGFMIAMLGLIGEYLSRILDQLSVESSYCIKEIHERDD